MRLKMLEGGVMFLGHWGRMIFPPILALQWMISLLGEDKIIRGNNNDK